MDEHRPRHDGTIFLSAIGLALAIAAAARAGPTFVVNEFNDAPAGGSLVDGVCETALGNHECTLRAAIQEANAAAGGGALVRVPAGTYQITIPAAGGNPERSGDFDVLGTTTIEGLAPSATIIDGNALANVFNTDGSGVVIRNLTVRNGAPADGTYGSGIVNSGVLSLENVVVVANQGGFGGGVYNGGTLQMRHCIVHGNTSPSWGGGIFNLDGTAQIEDSTISGNGATYDGGGIYNSGGHVTVERTRIWQNGANGDGGGIFSADGDAPGEVVVVNSTVELNLVGGKGGGIGVASGTASLVHVLVANNDSDTYAVQPIAVPGFELGGGLFRDIGAAMSIKNSIVADNTRSSYYEPSECGPYAIESGDYNLIDSRSACALGGVTTHVNAGNVDVPFGQTLPRGGFAPMRDSASVFTSNLIPAVDCTDASGDPLVDDARGYARSTGGPCDIGPFEGGAWILVPPGSSGRELLRNGGAAGAELGVATMVNPFESTAAPFWPVWGESGRPLLQQLYGAPGLPSVGGAPPGAGAYLFAGDDDEMAQGVQQFDISSFANRIDAGTLSFHASGWFGGTLFEADYADMVIEFWSPESGFLESVVLGGFGPAARNNETKLLPDSAQGFVPVDTRYVYVITRLTRSGGFPTNQHNDGYADKLSLTLPEPGATAAAIAAFAALAALRSGVRLATR